MIGWEGLWPITPLVRLLNLTLIKPTRMCMFGKVASGSLTFFRSVVVLVQE